MTKRAAIATGFALGLIGAFGAALAFSNAPNAPGLADPAYHIPYRPFLDPLRLHEGWWLLLLPMSLGVSIAYKAVRLPSMERFWRQVTLMTAQIIIAMIVLGAVSYLFVLVYVRWIAERAG